MPSLTVNEIVGKYPHLVDAIANTRDVPKLARTAQMLQRPDAKERRALSHISDEEFVTEMFRDNEDAAEQFRRALQLQGMGILIYRVAVRRACGQAD